VLVPSAARAFDASSTFGKRAMVLSVEAGGGEHIVVEQHRTSTDIEFWNAGVRISMLPFGAGGPGPLFGALEVGVEPMFQRYEAGLDAFYAGVGVVGRYHFLSLGHVVPYAELAASAGGTDLKVHEISSEVAFLLFTGVGASVFVTDSAALYAGYRFQHVSNGNTESPNRGFESHTAVVGLSVFFK
jgi:opacity protein-like surface antigen